MGGFFGVASKEDSVFDLFFGIDYHSHLGTRRGGMDSIVQFIILKILLSVQNLIKTYRR